MTSPTSRTHRHTTASQTTTALGTETSLLGVEESVELPNDLRVIHTLNLGPTSSGKTVLLSNVAQQDAQNGDGLGLLNPKGALIERFIARLPEERLDDIIYINPAREPVTPINVLEPQLSPGMTTVQKELQKEIIISDLIDLFKRRSESWGARFGRLLETLLRAHLDLNIYHGESKTLIDLYHCVVDQSSLVALIDQTDDRVVREQLVRIKEDLTPRELEPLQRRLNDFVMNPTIRRVIRAGESGFDFRKAVNDGKIILVDIQKGEVGRTVSEAIGSIVITKIWAATQSRIAQAPEDRRPFYLFVDELQNFMGEDSSLATMLSEAREYGLGCWFATQYLERLPTELEEAIGNNCRTKILFKPSQFESSSGFSRALSRPEKDTLSSLDKYQAMIQWPTNHVQNRARLFYTYPPRPPQRSLDEVEAIMEEQTIKRSTSTEVQFTQKTGKTPNAGGAAHQALLEQAEHQLTERGLDVRQLYQPPGEDKPDGHVQLPTGEIAHLEVEHGTLSKPAKVLKNLCRAAEQSRECIFAVTPDNAEKLEQLLSDPKNRYGDDYQDDRGSYSYYTDDGEPFTDIETIEQATYRILEVADDELTIHDDAIGECPELEPDRENREKLEDYCLFREDRYCLALEKECVLLNDE